MLIAVAFRHTLICLLPVPYLLIHPKGEQLQEQRLKEAYRRIASSRGINRLAEEVSDPHSVRAPQLEKITHSLVSLPSLHLSCNMSHVLTPGLGCAFINRATGFLTSTSFVAL